MKSLLERLLNLSHRSPWQMLVVAAVCAAIFGFMSSKLGFRGDMLELLPDSTPEVKDLKEIEDRAGGTGYLIVQVVGGTKEQRRAFAKLAAADIEARKEVVRFVEWKFDTRWVTRRALLLLETEKLANLKDDVAARIDYERKIANPLYVDLDEDEERPIGFAEIQKKYTPRRQQGDYLESQNEEELYLLVKATSTPANLDFNRKLIAEVRGAAEKLRDEKFKDLKLDYTGAYVVRVADDDAMQADLARSGVITGIVTLIILLLTARRLAIVPTVYVPLGVGIAATMGFTWAVVGHLNPVTGFLAAILVGLGIEYGLHLSMRYWEERARHEPLEAMRETLNGTFSGALSSAITNAAAFFVLIFAEFEAFKQFGKIASFGVMATLLTTYAFAPAVLFLSERFALRKPKAVVPHTEHPRTLRVPTFVLGGIVAVMTGLVAFSVWALPRVGFETNLLKITGESKAGELELHIAEQMGIIMIPAMTWVDSLDTARKVTGFAREIQKRDGENSSIADVASLNDLLPYDTDRRMKLIGELHDLMEKVPNSAKEDERVKQFIDMTNVQPWRLEELPVEFRRRFEPFDHKGTFVLMFPRYGLHDTARLETWAADLNTVSARATEAGIHAPILDTNRLAAKIFVLIRRDGPLVMGLAALVVFFVIWIALKKFTHTLMVTGPLFAGIACLPGGMFVGDISLNFLNVVVLPNLLAIAVDNSVHVFHRYKEEGVGSMMRIMRYTGLTAVVATFSNSVGYASMLIARHAGLRSVGMLAVVGVLCTFLGTTVLFPALIELKERIKGQKPEPRLPETKTEA
ncbi:MAG: hypothetical protein DI536_26625 [Archangium gephyra]|uniref:SSD domain-containing protein n=1 Tax=Archangium gephyra TaxID=48 RepID=A0A2W5T0W6_9BACT|nr:MAG: hypothetical protein DI536_26625 [Archangium gephyra]